MWDDFVEGVVGCIDRVMLCWSSLGFLGSVIWNKTLMEDMGELEIRLVL